MKIEVKVPDREPIGAMKKGEDDRGMLSDMSGGEPGDWSALET